MSTLPGKTVLITGANAGIGKDVARQLALRPEIARIYLACRNKDRATTAKAELEAKTGLPIFDIILMDVAGPGSVRAGLAGINGSLDALVMNAGTVGGKTALDLTADGVTYRVRDERSWPRRPPRGAPGRGPTWRGGGLRRKRSSQGSPEDADETAIVRLNLRRRARHCHRRQLFRRPQNRPRFGLRASQVHRGPLDGLPGTPTPRPPIHHREPRQHLRHPSPQRPQATGAYSGQIRHTRPGDGPQT